MHILTLIFIGSGKTTFLDLLTGRRQTGISYVCSINWHVCADDFVLSHRIDVHTYLLLTT